MQGANIFAFENALASTMKTEADKLDDPAFRICGGVDANKTLQDISGTFLSFFTFKDAPYTSGNGVEYKNTFQDNASMNDMSGILKYVIQRNNFDVAHVEIAGGYYYEINLDPKKILWYLPAVNQYKDPVLSFATGNTTFTPANFWSSTACEDDNQRAYLGSNEKELRTVKKQVVVQRIVTPIPQPTTISDISTEEMKGGDNGEAQWVE